MARPVRCAIYTRKSSEEGLEQSFNSLDAQREACEAYIRSQKHEGWTVPSDTYDDGGFSGGNMERPALRRLLTQVESGKVDTIVVYKVDRLTRSLADFAKIVEKLDKHKVSFVSVTQQFNTTTSMGRLTLNVLLSFAQFEREVTGERIRDKIAASKRKGMWMGGVVPIGYELRDRHLFPNAEEAAQVRQIFGAYLQQGCVSDLQIHLEKIGVSSKRRISRNGIMTGGRSFSRGALYGLLQNRIYLGEITHKEVSYPGQHEAIISRELWDRVQALFRANLQSDHRRTRSNQPRFLTGKLFDANGAAFTPTHTVKKGRRYHYYVSRITAKSGTSRAADRLRISADRLEQLVTEELTGLISCPEKLLSLLQGTSEACLLPGLLDGLRECSPIDAAQLNEIVQKVLVHANRVEVILSSSAFLRFVDLEAPSEEVSVTTWSLQVPIELRQRGRELRLVLPSSRTRGDADDHSALARAVARAHSWLDQIFTGKISNARALARQTGFDERYVSRILPLAFLAPDLTEGILDTRRDGAASLTECPENMPLEWRQQRAMFGVSP